METKLKQYLENLNIDYVEHKHPAVFTVEQHKALQIKTPNVLHTKNLFLKDNKNNFYLVCMYAEKQLNLKELKEKIQAKKKLSFASEEQLKEYLNLKPGSVSLFGMIHAKPNTVHLILDKQVWEAEKVGFHPNINTSTLEISHQDLEKFYNSLETKKEILEL